MLLALFGLKLLQAHRPCLERPCLDLSPNALNVMCKKNNGSIQVFYKKNIKNADEAIEALLENVVNGAVFAK
jgi:hypothetical protein